MTVWASHLDPADGVMWDISPAVIGNIASYPEAFEDYPSFYNRESGGDPSPGHLKNPKTDAAYAPQVVPRGDWFVIANTVNDHPLLVRRFGGTGQSSIGWNGT